MIYLSYQIYHTKEKMGTWGINIFEDDLAEDIKNNYIELLEQGLDNEEITNQLISEYKDIEEDEISIFWFALSSIQWEYGRLSDYVKQKTLEYIKNKKDLERWDENKILQEKRKKVIEELEAKIQSPMPKQKKIVKPKSYKCSWKIGDVYAYQIQKGEYQNKYIILIKVAEKEYYPKNICPVVYVYKKLFHEIPSIKELSDVPYLPQFYLPEAYKKEYKDILYRCLICIDRVTENYLSNYIYVGNNQNYIIPENETQIEYSEYLCFVEEYIDKQIEFYNNWKDIQY